jgi:hypothetical protein
MTAEFVPDSPLEESGFELLVPLGDAGLFAMTPIGFEWHEAVGERRC